jgi:HEAT repeat protein
MTSTDEATPDPRAVELVDAMAGSRWWEALQELAKLGSDALPAVRAGLLHGNWRVRRGCLAFLDHHADPPTLAKILPLLNDPKSDVRLWAIHALACDRCKTGERPIDVEPHLIERAESDESLRVRRQAVLSLAYLRPPDPRSARLFADVLEGETDRKLRLHAESGLRKARAAGLEPRTEPRERETGER